MDKQTLHSKSIVPQFSMHAGHATLHHVTRGFKSLLEGFVSFGRREKFIPRSPDEDAKSVREDWRTVGRYIREAMQQVMSVVPGGSAGDAMWESKSEKQKASVTSAITDLLGKEVPPEKSAAITNLLISVTRHHHGPLPDGETIAAYSRFIPDGGNRVMMMAENAQAHRHEMDRTAMVRESHQRLRGQWMAACITVLFLAASIFVILKGYEMAGVGMMGVLATVVSIFIYGEWKKKLPDWK